MDENKFKYTYTAPTKAEREEIEDIRRNYLPTQERDNKLKEIRQLDNRVKNIPSTISFIVAIVGVLIFGLGLTCILEWHQILMGIIISVIGCIPIGLAHFAYFKLTSKLKEKYKDRILTLSEELLNEDSITKNTESNKDLE